MQQQDFSLSAEAFYHLHTERRGIEYAFHLLQAPFVYHDGRLSVAFQDTGYYTEQEEPAVPCLTALQLEALRTVQALAIDPELSIHFLLQPGDIQLLHNTTVLHGREGFTDGKVGHQYACPCSLRLRKSNVEEIGLKKSRQLWFLPAVVCSQDPSH